MISKYSLVKAIPVASDPITLKRKSAAFSPTKVTMIEGTNAKITDWAINNDALFNFLAPIKLPIPEFVAAPIPTPTAMITK